ncbi:MAG: redox-regulated ATPase YchF [bacterium]
MKIAIIGLPQSGKTTLFNAISKSSADTGPAGSSLKHAHHSIIKVPDRRLDALHQLFPTARKVQATVEYVDVAGLEKGSTQRKGFQEQFLANLRNVDALICVLRAFENAAVPHPEGSVNPERDRAIIEDEFFISDMTILEARIQKLEKELKKIKDAPGRRELELLRKCLQGLESETPLREQEWSTEEAKMLRGFQFLTAKPILYVLNIHEDDIPRDFEIKQAHAKLAQGRNQDLVCLSTEVEMEIAQLSEDDAQVFRQEMGIKEDALSKVIRSSYALLGLLSFFTAGDKEVRAWTIRKGANAQAAAGAIHSDMERGFIRAEVVEFEKLLECGSFAKCKEQGVLRLEGKEYVVQDGDVVTFRFNV